MSSPTNPRKRPAPGASPIVPINPQQMQQPFSPAQADQVLRWNGAATDGNTFVDAGARAVNPFGVVSPAQAQYAPPIAASPSTALARRGLSRALVPSVANRQSFADGNAEPWSNFGEDGDLFPTGPNGVMDEQDNLARLEEMAQRAKREAQTKRKQIPPFVQKLSSFLDESRNTELIRWSDKGDSFIVLDEDEFAKTLIPELFKHNNYASFVRQLNMYGFHKRVGLSDNSMKASERKNKSPSEYYNPYFRRGHPNLLWLINKPKSGNSKKKGKKEEGDQDSDEDGAPEEAYANPPFVNAQIGRGSPAVSEVGPLQKKDLVQVKTQIDRLQQQQLAISTMLKRLQQEHSQLFQQAVMFQDMHERHENSINAILNFLANVFRKSLEEQGGANIQDLLASIIPNAQNHAQNQMPPQGSVVDLGDFINQQGQNVVTSMSPPKRQQRLLPPIPHHAAGHPAGKATTISTSSTPSPAPLPSGYQVPQVGSVTELFDTSPADTTSPAYIKNELQANPQEGMMKIIQDTNAVTSSGIDLPNVAAKTPVTMNNDQRSRMLNIMAGASNGSASTSSSVSGPHVSPRPAASVAPAAVPVSATPPPAAVPAPAVPGLADPGGVQRSISPISIPPVVPPPALHEFQITQAQLDALQQLQDEQTSQIDNLSNLLGPYSPSGRIPGLDDHDNPNTSYFDNVDYDQFINSNPFDQAVGGSGYDTNNPSNTSTTMTDGNLGAGDDFNFSLDGNADPLFAGDFLNTPTAATSGGGGIGRPGGTGTTNGFVENGSVTADTPSPAGTEEITRNDLLFGPTPPGGGGPDSPDEQRGTKRRRKS
ncbi:hypothetical protein QBC46DRAFT_247845 [Diplogelasinospora grovesii]|uniref:HSF-type DNA-binding domain-containing protein n=1 Tax=Diplogelasinospora grovesii TaxID=303347 RepID=A0AAN6NID6_9PEZI|nr:hypothetical protein QBC46DRAFT_247845 [Diplogelasinospora grovesii]